MMMAGQIAQFDWDRITDDLHQKGYALVSNAVAATHCDNLVQQYNNAALYRKTINMERYRFGYGEYKYFQYPLPNLIQQLREGIYPKLAPIANKWMEVLNIDQSCPVAFDDLMALCRANNQTKPTALILKYGQGGYNTLHQDLYGEVFFPMQLVVFLDDDYSGGEFVLVEQRPRAQLKAIVLKPKKGDMLLFTTNFRPVKSSKGYYRVNMKHGVSEVTAGSRHTLGIIFHDAL